MGQLPETLFEEEQKTGGRHAAAARFGFGLIFLLVFMAAGLTTWLVGTRDTLIGSVPAGTAAYLHSQENYGQKLIEQVTDVEIEFPENRPDEVSAYAQITEEELHWTILIRWLPLKPPSQATREKLSSMEADRIDRLTYRLETFAETSSGTFSPANELPEGSELSDILDGLRSLSRTQAAVTLPNLTDPETLPGFDTPKFLALALFQRPNWSITALIADPDELRQHDSWLGINQNNSPANFSRPPLIPVRTGISKKPLRLSLMSAEQAGLMTSLLSQTERERFRLGVPDSLYLRQARTKLQETLSGPVSVLIETEEGNEVFSFLSVWPTVKANDLFPNLQELISASRPNQSQIQLPDMSYRREFSRSNLVEVDINPYIIETTEEGTILTNSRDLLGWYLNEQPVHQQFSCLSQQNQDTFATKLLPDQFWQSFNLLGLDLSALKQILIQRSVNNFIHICG